jgi:uncharacterized protein (TIGR03435 family)
MERYRSMSFASVSGDVSRFNSLIHFDVSAFGVLGQGRPARPGTGTLQLAVFCGVIALLCLAAIAKSADAQDYPQKLVGQMAPQLKFESVLNGRDTIKAPAIEMKGSVTLLEFWFTTCGPCRQAVPHLNKIVRGFARKGLRTFAVTFDSVDAVRDYIKEVPIASPIAIDTTRSIMKAYGVFAYPTTFLIGKDGKVLSCTNPDAITEKVISDALAGKPIALKPTNSAFAVAPVATSEPDPAVASVRIAESSGSGMTFSVTPERVAIKGVGLRQLVQSLFNLEPKQSSMELQPDDRIFEVESNVPGGRGNAAMALLKAAVIETFHLDVKVEPRKLDVAVFRLKGPVKGVQPWNGKERGASANQFRGMPLGSIISTAAYMMGLLGIDETNDRTFYDFTLNFDAAKPVEQQVLETFGIEVTKEVRELPFTIVKQQK